MNADALDGIRVIDADAHVSEPYDLWTSRVSTKRWGRLVPYVRNDIWTGVDRWYFADQPSQAAAETAMAGWGSFYPDHPARLEDADPACWNAEARLNRLDEFGITAQVIYPNVGGFGSGRFLDLKEPELMLECVRAYNDFLSEWVSIDRSRLLPIMALPFWDVQESVREIERSVKAGHRGVLFCSEPQYFGQPFLVDPHWNPIWEVAQGLGLSINFHISSGDSAVPTRNERPDHQTEYVTEGVLSYLKNATPILDVIASGICHRYPKLSIVSVESGVGWIPFVLEALDWNWRNYGCHREHPEMDLLPSEYFRRQVYACVLFEQASAKAAISLLGPGNILYETDFPHAGSMAPGPTSVAEKPREFIARHFSDLPRDTLKKILSDNAARLYHLDEQWPRAASNAGSRATIQNVN